MHVSALVAVSQQQVLRHRMDLLAHRLANVLTPGFKSEQVVLKKIHKESGPGSGIAFVSEKETVTDMTQGMLETTGDPLHVALRGRGFLAVQTPQGTGYTRNGSLSFDNKGQLVTQNGMAVLSATLEPLVVPPGSASVSIGPDGSVKTPAGIAGQIGIFDFSDSARMKPLAGGVFQGAGQPVPATSVQILQGVLERSNVEPVTHLVEMIDILRHYQYNQQVIDADEDKHRQMNEKLALPRGA
jgi:flagellar basal-body rod protein FlgF